MAASTPCIGEKQNVKFSWWSVRNVSQWYPVTIIRYCSEREILESPSIVLNTTFFYYLLQRWRSLGRLLPSQNIYSYPEEYAWVLQKEVLRQQIPEISLSLTTKTVPELQILGLTVITIADTSSLVQIGRTYKPATFPKHAHPNLSHIDQSYLIRRISEWYVEAVGCISMS